MCNIYTCLDQAKCTLLISNFDSSNATDEEHFTLHTKSSKGLPSNFYHLCNPHWSKIDFNRGELCTSIVLKKNGCTSCNINALLVFYLFLPDTVTVPADERTLHFHGRRLWCSMFLEILMSFTHPTKHSPHLLFPFICFPLLCWSGWEVTASISRTSTLSSLAACGMQSGGQKKEWR